MAWWSCPTPTSSATSHSRTSARSRSRYLLLLLVFSTPRRGSSDFRADDFFSVPGPGTQYAALRDASPSGRLRLRDLPAAISSLRGAGADKGHAEKENSAPDPSPGLTDEEWDSVLKAVARAGERPYQDASFELFLRVYAEMQLRLKATDGAAARKKAGGIARSSSSTAAFLTAASTTLLHTISESEKASYVGHINAYLAEDPFLKDALPIDPATDHLFNLTKNGVLLW
jgi:plastin-1